MLENVELNKDKKRQFKVVAANQNQTMKALILNEAQYVIENNLDVPSYERESEEDRTSLIIDIPSEIKENIKTFTYSHNLKIRDLWVYCVDRILERYNNV